MIRKLRIRNFLSFKDVEVKLKPRTVLVGPNMSGKSNLMTCLRFLSSVLVGPSDASGRSGLEQAVFNLGGIRELAWKGSNDPTFDIELIVEVPSSNQDHIKTYEYGISVAGSFELQQITVVRESLIVESNSERKALFEVKMGEGSFYWNNQIQQLRFPGPSGQSALNVLAMPDFEGAAFRNVVGSWRFYDLMPLSMRKENPPTPQKFLQEYGDNFSAWLFTLQRYPEEFLHLKQATWPAPRKLRRNEVESVA